MSESEASSIEGTFKKPNKTSIKFTLDPSNLKNSNLSENEKNNYVIFFYIISCKQFPCNERTEIFFRLGNYISMVTIFGYR